MDRLYNPYLPQSRSNLQTRVFIGYDPMEPVAYNVLQHSIITRSRRTVNIIPLVRKHFHGPFTREKDPKQSTEFSDTRFLVPYLCNYHGIAIFMDCDFLCLGDIEELVDLADPRYAVQVVKHDYQPESKEKFLGNVQTKYQKKLWSAMMMFNCERCQNLTMDYVNTASMMELHQFKWLESDSLIGGLPTRWHHVVGHNDWDPNAKLIHFTEGGPYFPEYSNCEYSKEWNDEYYEAIWAAKKDEKKAVL